MPLYVIATPIGNPEDMTLRGQRLIDEADFIIGEEAKPTRKLLKSIGLSPQKPMELLNEHSKSEDIMQLAEKCKGQNVALVSDCGTPGFCDPGAGLVAYCRKLDIDVKSIPGPSSLTALLSVSGQRLDQFYFRGFLPSKTELRQKALKTLSQITEPIILMDTPYRLKKTLEDCRLHFKKRKLILGVKMSFAEEAVFIGTAQEILKKIKHEKAEFILIVS